MPASSPARLNSVKLRRCLFRLAMAAGIANAQIPMGEEPDLTEVDLPILAAAREHPCGRS